MVRTLVIGTLVFLAFTGFASTASAWAQADHAETEHAHEPDAQAEAQEPEHEEQAAEHSHEEGAAESTEEHSPEVGAEDHDHSKDHGDAGGGVVAMASKIHPMVVHFPIALILAAGLAEMLILLGGTKWLWLQGSVRFGVALGGLSALVAAPLGWLAASHADYGSDLVDTLLYHRILGVTTAIAAVLLWILSERMARSQDRGNSRKVFRGLLFATCVIVPVTGHLGATLVFGPGFLG
jgi:uncharacterized membrane protein